MALTIEVTKLFPDKGPRGFFKVGSHVVLKEDGVEVFSKDYPIDAKKGDDVYLRSAEIIAKAQPDIDAWKDENFIDDHGKYADLQTAVFAGLSTGE